MDEQLKRHKQRYIALGIFLLSLLVYFLTSARQASPVISADLLVGHFGLTPFQPMSHPVWGLAARLVHAVAGSAAVRVLNLFSVLCASAVLAVLFLLMTRWTQHRMLHGSGARDLIRSARTMSGLTACAVLAVAPPFWLIATRAYFAAFDLLLLLCAVYLLFSILEKPTLRKVYGFALLWGVGTTEFATFIVLSPFAAVVLIYAMWRGKLLRFKYLLLAALLYALGLCVYLLEAWRYTMTPAYEWREFGSYFKVLWFLWRDQYFALTRSVAPVGWLLILVVTVLPWFILVMMPMRRPGGHMPLGNYLLLLVLSVIALVLLFNVNPAPWRMAGVRPLLFTPYVFFAAWAGHLAGIWYSLLINPSRRTQTLRRMLRPVFLLLLAVLVLSSAWRTWPEISPRPGDAFHVMVQRMMKPLAGRKWILSDGYMDNNLLLAADAQHAPVRIINPRLSRHDAYLKYLASMFENERMKKLAMIGLPPLLNEWFNENPAVTGQVATVASADQWVSGGYVPYPAHGLFFGTKALDELDADRLYQENLQFVNELATALHAAPKRNVGQGYAGLGSMHLSKIQNNTGVLLEDMGNTDQAFAAYQRAREVNTNNISALMNMLALAMNEDRPEKEQLQQEFDELTENLSTRMGIWALSQTCGYVRNPGVYAQRGMAWALSGKPRLAINEISRAMELGGSSPRLQNILAALYFQADMDTESESTFMGILEEHPEDASALLGLARIAMRRNDFSTARSYLQRIKELGHDTVQIRMEEAVLEALAGNPDRALSVFEHIVDRDPKNMRAWGALALLAAEQRNEALTDQAVAALAGNLERRPGLGIILAYVEMNRENYPKAREFLEGVLARQPGNRQALDMVLRIDLSGRRMDKAETHAEQMLRLDPRHAFANYVMGTIMYNRGQYALAEQFIRVSLLRDEDPRALNDLAWLLQQRGADEEALRMIEKSLQIDNRNPSSWDTYGVILIKLGRLQDAEEAVSLALSQEPGNPGYVLHMAQILEKKNLPDKALELIQPLMNREADIPVETMEQIRALLDRVRS